MAWKQFAIDGDKRDEMKEAYANLVDKGIVEPITTTLMNNDIELVTHYFDKATLNLEVSDESLLRKGAIIGEIADVESVTTRLGLEKYVWGTVR